MSASEMTYIVSGGALNSTHSLIWRPRSIVKLSPPSRRQYTREIRAAVIRMPETSSQRQRDDRSSSIVTLLTAETLLQTRSTYTLTRCSCLIFSVPYPLPLAVAVAVTVSVKSCPYKPFMPLLLGRVHGNSAAGAGGRESSFPQQNSGRSSWSIRTADAEK